MSARLTRSLLAVALTAGSLAAQADDDVRRRSVPTLAAYTQECAACHLAYPPGLLPASSWRRLMVGLDRHFGSDATLDTATVAQLSAWLEANAASGRRGREAPPDDRITRADWFVREHREVPAAVWRHPSVRSAARCEACHTDAARGRFSEHALRVPPGLDPALARSWRD
jgi:hypothetical protein